MPSVIQGAFSKVLDQTGFDREAERSNYIYPFGLDLNPTSEFHRKLRDRILSYAQESYNVMSKRHSSWREIDRTLVAYIPTSEVEKKIQEEDKRRPVSIVVPIQYATLQILLTYIAAALIDDPIFRIEGVSPEDIPKAILLEHHLNYQARKRRMLLPILTICQDAFKYGFGVGALSFIREVGPTSIRTEVKRSLLRRSPSRVDTEIPGRLLYEGNELSAIDPYSFMPDVNFSVNDIENHEHASWIQRFSLSSLMRDESTNPDKLFNVRFLKYIDGRSSLFGDDRSGRADKSGISQTLDKTYFGKSVDVVNQYIDLVPKDWDLGNKDEIETWLFRIAGDEVIIDAGPTNLQHGKKPLLIVAPDYDGHAVSPISRLEIGYGISHSINWLYNAHITNVKKAINNILVVDPGLANYNDVVNTSEGAIIRIRRAMWTLGRINDAVVQLPITDVTSGFMNDVQILIQISNMVTGAQDAIAGIVSPKKERISSLETKQAAQSAISRLGKDARVIWSQLIYPMTEMMVSHTQQLMTEERWIKISGDFPKNLAAEFGIQDERVLVKPETFRDINIDLIPHDGTIPGHHGDPASLMQFLQSVLGTQNQEVIARVDFVKIVLSVARRLGIKEVRSWIKETPIQASVMPQEEIEKQVRSGNLEPLT